MSVYKSIALIEDKVEASHLCYSGPCCNPLHILSETSEKGLSGGVLEKISRYNEDAQQKAEELGTEHRDFVPRPNKVNTAIGAIQEQRQSSMLTLNADEILSTERSNVSTATQQSAKKRKIADQTSESTLGDSEPRHHQEGKKVPRPMRPYCVNCKGQKSSPKCDHVIPCTPCLNSGKEVTCAYDPEACKYRGFDPPQRSSVPGADLTKGQYVVKKVKWDKITGEPAGTVRHNNGGGARVKGQKVQKPDGQTKQIVRRLIP